MYLTLEFLRCLFRRLRRCSSERSWQEASWSATKFVSLESDREQQFDKRTKCSEALTFRTLFSRGDLSPSQLVEIAWPTCIVPSNRFVLYRRFPSCILFFTTALPRISLFFLFLVRSVNSKPG